MRVALVVVCLLALCGPLRAGDDDDDAIPDNQAPGPGIPERLHDLEREWTHDVGTPTPEDPDPRDEIVEPLDADDDATAHGTTPPAADELPRPKPSALSNPLPNPLESPLKDASKSGAADKKAAPPPPPPPPAPAPPPSSDSATDSED